MRTRAHGYTLMEMVVVLFIVAILGLAVGRYAFQPRQKPAVQNLLNELEGVVAESHKYASATLGRVRVNNFAPPDGTTGDWAARTFEINFDAVRPDGTLVPVVNRVTAAAFRDWRFAGVDTSGGAWTGTAVGAETLLASLGAVSADVQLEMAQALANPLTGPKGQIEINPFNKQFLRPFCIPVVGLQNGVPFAGAPAGVIVVTGSRIYKFYKPGAGASNAWRRL